MRKRAELSLLQSWGGIGKDLRYAFRGLLRSRGFAFVAVLSLAVGVGVNTAVLTAIYAVWLAPVPGVNGAERITELALTNVARHAKATLCTVGWNYELKSRELVLTIVDDGVGFGSSSDDEAEGNLADSNSLGLVTMNDYADALGGVCLITSEPGEGTRVEVRFPFETGDSDDDSRYNRDLGSNAVVAKTTGNPIVGAEFAPGAGS